MSSPQRHTGNASKARDKERVSDSMLLVEIPPIPDTLSEVGAFWWEYYCGLLIESGNLSRMYIGGLTHLCFLAEIIEATMQEIKSEGNIIPVPKMYQGQEYVEMVDNPRVPKLMKMMSTFSSLADKFGLTPFAAKVNNMEVGGTTSTLAAPPSITMTPPPQTT